MEVSGISSATVSAISNTGSTGNAQTIAVLKKADDIQKSTAAALIESVPEPPKAQPDSTLGRILDIKV